MMIITAYLNTFSVNPAIFAARSIENIDTWGSGYRQFADWTF